MDRRRSITIIGAGILGLWQAVRHARDGHSVRLLEATAEPFTASASRYAGAMLAPWCEAEAAPAVVRDLGIEALAFWRDAYPDIVWNGTLVVAPARDRAELVRFARLTERHETLDGASIARTEPELAGRFATALLYPDEGHMDPRAAMRHLLGLARYHGVDVAFGVSASPEDAKADAELVIDCRGLAARDHLPDLRGVRGERVLVSAPDLGLTRCIRLLHPRHPLYIVPWSDGLYMVGATVVEREDDGPMTVRSALELLGAAYAVHPGFAEAEIVELGAGVRPAFADNVPAVIVRDGIAHVNGAYRHGFLLAPVLADAVARRIAGDGGHPLLRRA